MQELPNVVLRVALSQPCRAERGQFRPLDALAVIVNNRSPHAVTARQARDSQTHV
jgi:hypothetical protein